MLSERERERESFVENEPVLFLKGGNNCKGEREKIVQMFFYVKSGWCGET